MESKKVLCNAWDKKTKKPKMTFGDGRQNFFYSIIQWPKRKMPKYLHSIAHMNE
jgi:hypothetical protein